MAVDNCTPSLDIPMSTIRKISDSMTELGIQDRNVTANLPQYINYNFLEVATGKKKEQLGYTA